uniref:Uncharacterized protein n=1 Tax=Oryza nivara TaxID=4536 RepID=A0A0E0FIF9_ORYNI
MPQPPSAPTPRCPRCRSIVHAPPPPLPILRPSAAVAASTAVRVSLLFLRCRGGSWPDPLLMAGRSEEYTGFHITR